MRLVKVAVAVMMVFGLAVSADADVVVIKRDAGVTDHRVSQVFKDAINGATIIQYTDAASAGAGQSGDVADDTSLWGGTTAMHTYINQGIRSGPYGSVALFKFAVAELDGFLGGTVSKAELRVGFGGGNSGGDNIGSIASTNWSEGNKNNSCPGLPTAAPGATAAHPNGLNTSTNQNAAGGTTPPLASWGDGNDFFSPAAQNSAVISPWDGTTPGDGAGDERAVSNRGWDGLPGAGTYSGFAVWDVTDVVTNWAAGTPNYGFYQPSLGNWAWQYSETTLGITPALLQPALFIEYTPKARPIPEPAGLGLLGVALLGLRRKRS